MYKFGQDYNPKFRNKIFILKVKDDKMGRGESPYKL